MGIANARRIGLRHPVGDFGRSVEQSTVLSRTTPNLARQCDGCQEHGCLQGLSEATFCYRVHCCPQGLSTCTLHDSCGRWKVPVAGKCGDGGRRPAFAQGFCGLRLVAPLPALADAYAGFPGVHWMRIQGCLRVFSEFGLPVWYRPQIPQSELALWASAGSEGLQPWTSDHPIP